MDTAGRGTDPEADACLTVAQMKHLIATWIVKIWQNRRLGSYAPSWDPSGDHSHNSLFASSMQQGGFALRIPSPELYYQLLPQHRVMIHGKHGVKIRNLWYDGEALEPYPGELSRRGGQARNTYVIHRDPRDPCFVFFQDPRTHDWRTLRWTGMPDEDEVPAFSEARVRDAMRELRRRGLAPKDETELPLILLELIGKNVPVDQWPTRLSKKERIEHPREVAQAAAGQPTVLQAPRSRGRPGRRRHRRSLPFRRHPPRHRRGQGCPAALEEARSAGRGPGERRRRREAAVPEQPPAPQSLSERLRASSLLALPDSDTDVDDEEPDMPTPTAEEEADQ
ncbi:hypothetical protein ABZ734_05545 [Streptomyces sp. NPDC006660]|uniref:hypothetical protein n=1 Tax=Streptomyces sp. NPDC006660 TaxID=3156901 RepID=UPI0033F299A0